MSPEIKKLYPKDTKKMVHIETSKYDAFLQQILQAETVAKNEKLGIWSDEYGEEE